MMHGFARYALFWNRWVPAIAESRRIYRPDLLGCGRSDVPGAGYRFKTEKIETEILALLDAFSLPRVHWVGESSGGLIGLLLAAADPERIASLVLCNTPTRISDDIRRIYALDRESTAAAMRAYGVGEWCRRTLGYRLDLEHASEALREWCIAEMGKTRPDVAASLHECFESVEVKPILSGISAPVLLLSGDKSRIASEQQKILARACRTAGSSCLPDMGMASTCSNRSAARASGPSMPWPNGRSIAKDNTPPRPCRGVCCAAGPKAG